MAESSVERGRRLKRKRNHLLQESSVERGKRLKQKHVDERVTQRLKRKRKRKHVVERVTRVLKSELKNVEDLLRVRVLSPESSVERGKVLKRIRKHVVERVIRLLKSELKNVDDLVDNVEGGTPPKSDSTYNKQNRNSLAGRKKQKQIRYLVDGVNVKRGGTPPKSDLTYKKQMRYSRKKQFVADRKKQFRANMAARRKHRMEIKTAEASFHVKSRNLSEFDAIDPPPILPPILRPIGGIRPYSIDGVDSGRLAGYCKTALKEFNECNHQDPKFDFDGLVKATRRLPTTYFITFKAKKQDDASPTIFQTHIKGKFDRSIEVISCAIKKD